MQGRLARVLMGVLAFSLVGALPTIVRAQDEPEKVRQPRVKPKPTDQPAQPPPAEEDPDDAPNPDPSKPSQPGAPNTQAPAPAVMTPAPAGSPPTVRMPGPYIKREKERDWTLTVNLSVRPDRSYAYNTGLKDRLPEINEFNFQTLSMVFPLPTETASSSPDPSSLIGKLLLNDRVVSDQVTVLDKQISGELYHSGTRLMRFATDQPTVCREIGMEFSVEYRCYNTDFDEEHAMQVDWPSGEIPELSKSTMAPQIFVDYGIGRGDGGPATQNYDQQVVKKLVDSYTGGNPRGAKPVVAAKHIAGQIIRDFQVSGLGLRFLNTGELQGFDLQGIPTTIQNHRGSEFDIASVLVAAYRTAGIPARLMIGYDLGGDDKKADDFLRNNPRNAQLKSWVEFGLYDEPARTLTWIPVDVVRMRKNSSRPAAVEKPWKFFGTHDELNRVVPLAFGFHPPTTVESYGAPGLWGWLMTPAPPQTAYQAIRFRASTTAKTSQDMPTKKNTKKKKDKDGKY